jgi:hypothetical protein
MSCKLNAGFVSVRAAASTIACWLAATSCSWLTLSR